jgi:hypothetical protein
VTTPRSDTTGTAEQGRAIVREVFARVRRADPSVADLFAEDAVITIPGAAPIVGRDAIRAHYERVFANLAPQPQVTVLLAEPPHYVGVIDVVTTDAPGGSRAVDLFDVGEDGIRSLAIYSQRG